MLCGLWALLAATRLTRGEEDSGRWDLLLAGRARLLDLVTRSAVTLTLAAAAMPARTRLLGSATGFPARRALAPTTGWAVGIAAYFLIIGAVISSILEFLTDKPRFAELAATAGFGGLGSAPGFAAAMFALLAIPTGLYAATRIAAVAADEKTRRSTILHSLPLSRYQLAGAEIAVITTGIASLLATAAIGLWTGAALCWGRRQGNRSAGSVTVGDLRWVDATGFADDHRRPGGRGEVGSAGRDVAGDG